MLLLSVVGGAVSGPTQTVAAAIQHPCRGGRLICHGVLRRKDSGVGTMTLWVLPVRRLAVRETVLTTQRDAVSVLVLTSDSHNSGYQAKMTCNDYAKMIFLALGDYY